MVIAGGGFGGLYAASYLAAADVPPGTLDVTLISRTNYFTFTPLLAEVVAGTLGREHVTVPFRVLGAQRGFQFVQGTVLSVEEDAGRLHTTAGAFDFEYLVLALGALPRYFGNEGLADATLPFTSVAEALAIRDRVLRNAEQASQERDAAVRRRLLTFAVAGAGPAGIEVASEIAHLLHAVLFRYYGVADAPRLLVFDGGKRILTGWDARLAAAGVEALGRRGVTVHLKRRVMGFDRGAVRVSGPDGAEAAEADALIWTVGTAPATEPLQGSGIPLAASGHVEVDHYLRARGSERVFAVGDAATLTDQRTGRRYPPVAPIAISQGVRAAANIENAVMGRHLEPFHAHHAGKIVSLGGGVALVDILGWTLTGPLAWTIYRTAYLLKLVGTKNKVRAGVTLLLNRLFERDLTCEC